MLKCRERRKEGLHTPAKQSLPFSCFAPAVPPTITVEPNRPNYTRRDQNLLLRRVFLFMKKMVRRLNTLGKVIHIFMVHICKILHMEHLEKTHQARQSGIKCMCGTDGLRETTEWVISDLNQSFPRGTYNKLWPFTAVKKTLRIS